MPFLASAVWDWRDVYMRDHCEASRGPSFIGKQQNHEFSQDQDLQSTAN
jgi:hypothetical protein